MKKFIGRIKSINFKYFVSELFIVVVGILIALTLNNWSEDNSNKNREQFYLKSLRNDFKQSLASLTEILDQNIRSDSSVTKLLVLMNNETNIPADSAIKVTRHLFGFNRFVPASGTYKEIISTGSLQILQNDNLRIALSSWDDMIVRNRQLEDVMFWQYHIINIPYINRNVAKSDYRSFTGIPGGKGKYKTDFKKLFGDPEFVNILYGHKGAIGETNNYLRIMIRHVEHIIDMIEKDIED